jgi:NitT/TauT family transport system ATP-binding protein
VASILARKEIFAARLQRIPILRWLIGLVKASDDRRLNARVAQMALELEFPREEAQRQIETMVDWGRYAELLAYDDSAEAIYLEPEGTSRSPHHAGPAGGVRPKGGDR